jgi:aldehyde:ferredoxin oxidoreductase
MSRIVRVDVERRTISEGPLPDTYQGLGGRGLSSAIVAHEVPPQCVPLGAQNKLVVAPGLLSGTQAANSGRLSIGAKSPLTGGIKESNAGGTASAKLARLGVAALVVENHPKVDRLSCLLASKSGLRFVDGEEYRGLGNYALVDKIRHRYGRRVAVLCAGPAAERRMANSTIAVTSTNGTPSRQAGRGGLGAVMASKGLKAIVVDDEGAESPSLEEPERFARAARKFTAALKSYPAIRVNLPKYGTNRMSTLINEVGGYPVRNFRAGRFEGIEKVDGEALYRRIQERGGRTGHAGCTNCIIRCSNEYVDRHGAYVTSSLEYETIWAHGANCGVDDLDTIAQIDRLCDDYGFDTIELGCSIALAMEKGIIEFGDAAGALSLVREAGEGTALGRTLGGGVAAAARDFGIDRVPAVKGQCLTGYDPRAIQGIGVTFATTPMGADHTAGYAVISNVLGVGGAVHPLRAEGQVELSRKLQVRTAAIDATGLCYFILSASYDVPESLEAVVEMLNARFGWRWTHDDFLDLGRKILKSEREFNQEAGLGSEADRLPRFMLEEKLPPHDTTFVVKNEELDALFDF